ncbi:MAG: ABC transporter permease, partial [Gammaproteobacteria bacterium]
MSRLAETVETLFVPLFALLVSAAVLAAFVAMNGADPLGVFQTLYRGGFGTWFSFQNTLQRAAPLMLT